MEPKARTWALSTKGWHSSFCECGDPAGHLKLCLDFIEGGGEGRSTGGGGPEEPGDEDLICLLEELEKSTGESGTGDTAQR